MLGAASSQHPRRTEYSSRFGVSTPIFSETLKADPLNRLFRPLQMVSCSLGDVLETTAKVIKFSIVIIKLPLLKIEVLTDALVFPRDGRHQS